MNGFTKLFASLVTSTIWREDDKTRIVWVTMLALSDRNGEVGASVPGLAAMANVGVEECRASLEKLLAPDLDSRTEAHEGRRIEKIEGGWVLLNHEKYRELGRGVDRTEYLRIKQRESRARRARGAAAPTKPTGSLTSTSVNHDQPITEAEAEADPEKAAGAASDARAPAIPVAVVLARAEEALRTADAAIGSAGSVKVDGDWPVPPGNDAPLWHANDWLMKFGAAWAIRYQTPTYGGGSRDAKATAELGDVLRSLTNPERLQAQERAREMFDEYLDDDRAAKDRHPWIWFVDRFKGLRVKAKPGAAAGRQASTATRDAFTKILTRKGETS